MTRAWLLAGVVASALTAAPKVPFYKQAQDFARDQAEKAQRSGLSRKELKQRYPTPEVKLVRVTRAMPGEVVEISARGNVPAAALVGFSCDELDVLSLRHGPSGIQARVRVPKTMIQTACFLEVVAPMTGLHLTMRALEIHANYKWRLRLSNGLRLEADALETADGQSSRSTWIDSAGNRFERRVPAAEARPGEQRWWVDRNADDIAATGRAWREAPERAELAALWKELSRQRKAADAECGGSSTCHAEREAAMRALMAERLPRLDRKRLELFNTHPVACDQLVVEVSEQGRVTGKAYFCASGGTAEVIGDVKTERP